MNETQTAGAEQKKLWNGPGGRGWVETQELLEQLFRSLEDLLVRVAAGPGDRILDVGCGTGSTTCAVARRLGETGGCVGLDISEPMIAAARVRARRENSTARFIQANAQTHDFGQDRFDMVISRFGVMFFDDPIQAFANLRRATKEGGELRLITWRSIEENPFMTTAERAAAPLLPNLPPRVPDVPGQFGLADRHRIQTILEKSGWTGIDIQPLDVACVLPEPELVRYLSWLGPVGAALQEVDEHTRAQVIATVRPAFAPFVHGAEVRFTAACWMVAARCPAGFAA
jgi:SAM-dependent methyltransferase